MTKKEIEAAIKPELMAKLKQLRVKIKFMNNIIHPKWVVVSDTEWYLKQCLGAETWSTFIKNAFNWTNSPEGYDFWENIYSK